MLAVYSKPALRVCLHHDISTESVPDSNFFISSIMDPSSSVTTLFIINKVTTETLLHILEWISTRCLPFLYDQRHKDEYILFNQDEPRFSALDMFYNIVVLAFLSLFIVYTLLLVIAIVLLLLQCSTQHASASASCNSSHGKNGRRLLL